ncbi:MAG: polyprenyl synthetase family protein [Bifidobacteriaceae bacterium]|jgi:geranylgeranyl diphosphate synthase type I|nr:polyprenyl synthetase family protein [Bifidobacteriaceae bacterium]
MKINNQSDFLQQLRKQLEFVIQNCPYLNMPVDLNMPSKQNNSTLAEIIISSFDNSSFRRALSIMPFVEFGVAIELFQNAALIHDDIIDKALTRRGQKSIPVILGSARALLVANILYSLAFERFLTAAKRVKGVQNYALDKIVWQWWQVFDLVQAGQILDFELANYKLVYGQFELIEQKIEQVIWQKTTSYTFILPAQIRSFASNKPALSNPEIKQLQTDGLAFQMQNDFDNVFPADNKVTKDQLSDIYNRKKTLLLIATLKKLPKVTAQSIIDLYNSDKVINYQTALFIKGAMAKANKVPN